MFFQRDNYGFSAPVVFCTCVPVLARGKAKAGPMREASASGLAYEDASPKASTVGAVNVDKLTELAIITLGEHLPQ